MLQREKDFRTMKLNMNHEAMFFNLDMLVLEGLCSFKIHIRYLVSNV